MANAQGKKKCNKILHTFCICFIEDITHQDILLLEDFVQIYKDPKFIAKSLQILDERSVRFVGEFFRLYGEKIKNTEIKPCVKIAKKYCICFIKDLRPEDTVLLENILKLNQDATFQSFSYQIVKDRDLRIISYFYSLYGEQINKIGQNESEQNTEYVRMSLS